MSYQVIWSELALQRLEEIYNSLAQTSTQAARKLAEEIFDQTATLADFPRRGRLYPGSPEPDLRELLVAKFRVIYELHESEEQVRILTVRHQRRQLLYPENI